MCKFNRKEIQVRAKSLLVGKNIFRKELPFPIEFNMTGIKKVVDQRHKHRKQKNDAIFEIESLIQKAIYKGTAPNVKTNSMVKRYYYFETSINNEPSYIVIREMVDRKCIFYSIVDRIRDNVAL